MPPKSKFSERSEMILAVLADGIWRTRYDLQKMTGLNYSTTYLTLREMLAAGSVTDQWDGHRNWYWRPDARSDNREPE